MATPQSDGSIILTTKVVTTGIQKGMQVIKKSVKTATVAVTAFGTAVGYLVKQSVSAYAEFEQLVGGVETLFGKSAEKVRKYADEAYKTAGLSANEYMKNVTSFSASLLNSLGGDTEKAADVANDAIIAISDNVNKMGSDYESVQNAFQGFAKQQYQLLDNLKLGYGGTKTEMGRLLKEAQAITGVEYNIDNLADVYTAIGVIQENLGIAGTTAKEAATTISGSASTMKASWQNVLTAISGGGDIDEAIENLVNSIEIYFENILPVVERALMGIGTVIERIAPRLIQTVANAFIKALPQLINAVWQMIQGLFQGIKLALIELLSGKPNEIVSQQAEKTKETAKNQKQLTKNIQETNKELKKTLAGFDDIQILSSQVADDTSGGLDAALQGLGGDLGGTAPDGSAYVNEADKTLTAIMGIIALSLTAVGLILLFAGHIGWGIGFVIAGAATLAVTMASASEFGYDGIIQMLTTIMGVAGGALLALGIILVYFKILPTGIGMIVEGASLIVSSVALQGTFNPSDIASWLSIIMGIAGGALLAIGIFLCYMKIYPVGIGMIIAGSASLISSVALGSEDITSKIKGWVAVIMAIAGGALLVIGIILAVAGNFIIGIPLIAVGAISLVTPIALNWNSIVTNIKNFLFENSKLIALISGGLLILGILVCFVNLPLGIALIAAGAAGLVIVTALNWDSIVGWVKGAWNAVKGFWNQYIAPVFTLEFWKNLAIKCGNGLIAGFEGTINGIIWAFESMINWIVDGLNKISIDIPDWVPGIGGETWGVNIPHADLGRVSIPRLARGAVIPPNREFLAVLGDQKRGTNIEAPAELIKQMAKEAMLEIGGAGQATREEHYYLGETELMSILYKLVKGGQRLNGDSLAVGGDL